MRPAQGQTLGVVTTGSGHLSPGIIYKVTLSDRKEETVRTESDKFKDVFWCLKTANILKFYCLNGNKDTNKLHLNLLK